jgi:Insertion element 4 transposase N-terminal
MIAGCDADWQCGRGPFERLDLPGGAGVLGAPDEIEDAVEAAGKTVRRKGGKLPPQVMVYFVMALALFSDEDYEEVWARLTETLAGWGGFGDDQALVTTTGV